MPAGKTPFLLLKGGFPNYRKSSLGKICFKIHSTGLLRKGFLIPIVGTVVEKIKLGRRENRMCWNILS